MIVHCGTVLDVAKCYDAASNSVSISVDMNGAKPDESFNLFWVSADGRNKTEEQMKELGDCVFARVMDAVRSILFVEITKEQEAEVTWE